MRTKKSNNTGMLMERRKVLSERPLFEYVSRWVYFVAGGILWLYLHLYRNVAGESASSVIDSIRECFNAVDGVS